MDPLPRERRHGPRAHEKLPLAIRHEAERAARVLLVGPRARDRLGELDGHGDHVEALLPRLLIGQADGCDLRIGEDDPRNDAVVGPRGTAEDVCNRHSRLVLPDVGEERDAGDVADRPDAVSGAAPLVDGDAVGIRIDSDRFQAQFLRASPTSARDDEDLAAHLVAVLEAHDALRAVALSGHGTAAEAESDSFLFERHGDPLADLRGLAPDQALE